MAYKDPTGHKTVSLSKQNYLAIKNLGTAGDSLNDVITDLLKKLELSRKELEKPNAS